jgi:uncharacterized protein (TIGR03086 family)
MNESPEVVARIERGVTMTGRIVAGVAADQWSTPSPCDGWTVRDVLNHVVGGMRIFAAELNGREPEAEHEADWLGADPVDAFATAGDLDLAAWHTPEAFSGTVSISLGQLPASFAAVIHLVELVTHGVDLAVATGQLHLIDEQLCAEVLGLLTGMGGVDPYRVPTVFGPEVLTEPEAPAHARLAAYLGRHLIDANASATTALTGERLAPVPWLP